MDNTQKLKFFAFGATIIVLSFIIYQTPALAAEIELPPVPENLLPIEVAEEPDVSEPGEPPSDLEEEPGSEEPPSALGEEPGPEVLPGDLGEDAGPFPEDFSTDLELEPGIDVNLIYEDLHSIRQNTDIFLFFVIPVSCAFYVIIKFCVWFYSTFLESAL